MAKGPSWSRRLSCKRGPSLFNDEMDGGLEHGASGEWKSTVIKPCVCRNVHVKMIASLSLLLFFVYTLFCFPVVSHMCYCITSFVAQ